MENNYQVLRKLENAEVAKNRTLFGPNVLVTIRFRSRLNLFERLDKVRAGIVAWKSMHRFLRAKVVSKDDGLYFVVDENSSANRNLENVQFLRLRKSSTKNIDSEFLYDLVIEKFISEMINCEGEHELLWRLALLELDNQRYELLWQFHHIIGDGLSAKENITLLLSLISKSLRDEQIEPIDLGLYPGTGKLFEKEIRSLGEIAEREPVLRPAFVDPDRARETSGSSLEKYAGILNEIDHFELIDLNRNGETYATRDQLIEFSKSSSYQKPKRFIIHKNEFLKLQKK